MAGKKGWLYESIFQKVNELNLSDKVILTGTVADVETGGSTKDNFIWTPFSATTPTVGAGINSLDDWTNGYGVPGYPGVGQNMQIRVFSH